MGFDTTNNTLRAFYKGRGLGDCGSLHVYGFEGTNSVLKEVRERDYDNELPYAPPAEWELIDLSG